MRPLLRHSSRLTISAMALSGLAFGASTMASASARVSQTATSSTSTPPSTSPSGRAAGQNLEGDAFVTGPADLIRKLCPDTVRVGFVCLFSGVNETGQGIAVYRGDNRPPSKCDDVPVPFEVANVENETNKAIVVGEGTCALKGPVTDANIDPGADENISPTDIWISG
jgi:hypothetical protein